MFDPVTSALITAAPPLTGLDLEDLPKRLTKAFADIVSARIRLREAKTENSSQELKNTLLDMHRLAAAQEAFVSLLPDRENRSAAAFVAASAHQVCLMGAAEATSSYVTGSSVAPEISATLLFLVAEAHADAAESAKHISVVREGISEVEKSLLLAIQFLALGRPKQIEDMPLPVVGDYELADKAVDALLLELFKGVKSIASLLLRPVAIGLDAGGVENPIAYFERVRNLCIGQMDQVLAIDNPVFNLFPGPLHLANLLLAVNRDIFGSSLTRIPTPNGLDGGQWWQVIRRMAKRRPFLWRNHLEALNLGYLEKGVSSAISFPTGAGKSTLSELKIANTLLRGEKVVFLVPTHALVDQTTKALEDTFDTFNIVGDVDDQVSISEIIVLPEAIVTTPERCLMLMSVQPDAFADLGLIIFDECHLLHPRDAERSRRSIDSMLAVLNLTLLAPDADLLLLSAMMKNAEEIAEWVRELTGRNCLALNLSWKPTRQVRGSVVYPATSVRKLNEIIKDARTSNPGSSNIPAAVKRTLKVQPFGFFSLLQTWVSQDREDYTLLPLLPEEHSLSTGKSKRGGWYLTPNGNQTSATLAAAAASSGLKTLVFVQSTVLAEASSKNFKNLWDVPIVTLSEAESTLFRLASEEMGDSAHCYLDVESDGTFVGGAASHHGLLLREERLLHESLFKRKDGICVLFATSTLAQGMNLPSEFVIISGDARFDPSVDKMAQLEAHELLNAAGRAGRAGEQSQGIVLVVPSRVMEFDDETNMINEHWMTLQSIFSQSDQCLIIDDPITALLDLIHSGTIDHGMPAYFLSRLPSSNAEGEEEPIHTILNRSFSAFRARKRNDDDWVASRIDSALRARKQIEAAPAEQWLEQVSGLTGVSIQMLTEINGIFEQPQSSESAVVAIDTILGWLNDNPKYLLELIRPENLESFFGNDYSELATNTTRGQYALPIVSQLLKLWMSGAPLNKMEEAYPKGGDRKRCKRSRHFRLRIVPDLSFLAGLPARLLTAKAANDVAEDPANLVLETLGGIIREGCDSPESLANKINMGQSVSRVAAREQFELIRQYIPVGQPAEDFDETRNRLRTAEAIYTMSKL